MRYVRKEGKLRVPIHTRRFVHVRIDDELQPLRRLPERYQRRSI